MYKARPNAITTGCRCSRRKFSISFSSGEWKPLITTLSVWQMDSAHWCASWTSCGVALREAKNATSGLSKSSVFPDKSIKKRRRCIYLSRTQGLGCPLIRISNTNTHAGWYISTHRANVSGEYIHLSWIFCCRPSNEFKPPSFEFRRIVKKYPIKCMASRPRSLAGTKISKISESPDIWVITILREPQRHIKFSTNFAARITRIQDANTMGVNYCLREKRKSFGFFSFCLAIIRNFESK